MNTDISQRMAKHGIVLPAPPKALGAYQSVVEAGSLIFVSMQGPIVDGRASAVGLVGQDLTIEDARQAARLAVINALAQLHGHLASWERIVKIVRLDGYVASAEGFTQHPQVLDAASELLLDVFQERAGHARTVSGVRNLPGNLPVGVAIIAEWRGDRARSNNEHTSSQ